MNFLLKLALFCNLILMSVPGFSITFLSLSDIHYDPANLPGYNHDTGDEAWAVALKKYKELTQDVSFVLLLGDLPTHQFFLTVDKSQDEQKVFADLKAQTPENIPLFYVPGNNDSLIGNYQPFSKDGVSPLNNAQNWDGACLHCKQLIIDDSHMQQDGYYASYVIPNNTDIMLIALNATIFTHTPPYAHPYPNQDEDAQKELTWIKEILEKHHAKQLLIAMHEPPGIDFRGMNVWVDAYQKAFVELLLANQSNFDEITLLTSHSHMDEIKELIMPNGKPIYALSTPAISRINLNNMAMKKFILNHTYQITNFITFYSSLLTEWNDEKYQAIGLDGIFNECSAQDSIATCLTKLGKAKACDAIQNNHMLSVKSENIQNLDCLRSYSVL